MKGRVKYGGCILEILVYAALKAVSVREGSALEALEDIRDVDSTSTFITAPKFV